MVDTQDINSAGTTMELTGSQLVYFAKNNFCGNVVDELRMLL